MARFNHSSTSHFSLKSSAIGDMLVPHGVGQPIWTPDRYDAFAREVYCKNAISFRCIDIVARGVSTLSVFVERRGKVADNHPLTGLIRKTAPMQSGYRWLYEAIASLRITGNLFAEAVTANNGRKPQELYVLRPDRVTIVPGKYGLPGGYQYKADSGRIHQFETDPATGMGSVFHVKEFHPLDDWYGMAPAHPAMKAIDQHSSASNHNQALLQNQARPSGAFIYSPPVVNGVTVPLDENQIDIVAEAVKDRYTDTSRRGLPLVLGDSWTYQNLMLSPRELDFWQGSQQNAREICAAYGVPHVLVVPGEATYANRDSAYLELWENTIIPMATTVFADLSIWFSYLYREEINLRFDIDKIPALAQRRAAHRSNVVQEYQSGLITRDEAREALDYEPASEGGDTYKTTIMRPASSDQEDGKKSRAGQERKAEEDEEPGLFDDEFMIAVSIPVILEALRDFGQYAIDNVELSIAFDVHDPEVAEFMRMFGGSRIRDLVGATTRKQLAEALAQAVEDGATFTQQIDRIREVFKEATTERAAVIARTETVRAANFGAVRGMVQAGIEHKEWLTTVDDRARDSHQAMHRQVVGVDERFTDPLTGSTAEYPGGFGIAAQDINCRCLALSVPNKKAGKLDAVEEWKAGDLRRMGYEDRLKAALVQAFNKQEEQAILALRDQEKARIDLAFRNTFPGNGR